MGLKRFVLDNPRPFIVRCDHGGDHFRGQPADRPLSTITGHHGYGVVAPYIAGVGGRSGQSPPTGPGAPLGTITGKNDRALVTPYLTAQFGEAIGQLPRTHDVAEPIPTITARAGGGFPVVAPYLVRTCQNGGNGAYTNASGDPLTTIVSKAEHCLVAPTLLQYNGEQSPGEVRGQPLSQPINTVTGDPRFALVEGFLAAHAQRDFSRSVGHDAREPIGTITGNGNGKAAVVETAFISAQNGDRPDGSSRAGSAADAPLPTTTGRGTQNMLAAGTLVHMNHGDKQWSAADAPLRTILGGANHHGLVRAFLTKYFGRTTGQGCGDPLHTVTGRDRFGVVTVAGQDYAIVDIGLRMLTPRELFRCQGFPDDYRIDVEAPTPRRPDRLRVLPKTAQVRLVGNSVPPDVAEALVRANFPEECAPGRRARTKGAVS